MTPELLPLATYAGPPVIGAFIGYLTNRVAIRMLFRPLKAWSIFGIRVPMTPGVIPSKRYELAANIGEMVGHHLLTSTEIGTALSTEQFQQHLHTIIASRLEDILDKDLGSIAASLSEDHINMVSRGVERFSDTSAARLTSYFAGSRWEKSLKDGLAAQMNRLGSQPVEALVDKKTRSAVYGPAARLLKSVIASPGTEKQVGAILSTWFEEGCKEERTFRQVCPEELVRMLHTTVADQAPNLLELMGRQFAEPDVRKKIIQGILGAVDHFLDSLGPMGAMAKGFIDAENLEKSLDAYLRNKEDEILSWLQDPQLVEKVKAALRQQVDTVLDKGFAEIREQVGNENIETVCRISARMLLTPLSDKDTGSLQRLLEDACEALLQDGRMTVTGLLQHISSPESSEAGDNTVYTAILAFTRSDHIKETLQELILGAVHGVLHLHMGRLSSMIHPSFQQALTEYGVMALNRIFLKEVPGLVQSLQISQLVTEKINTLDLLKLEQLLLSIMEEQFKYINLFGALLGFIIGLVNLFILQLG